MAKNPLLKSVFRAQLQAEAPGSVIGLSKSAPNCPITWGLRQLGLRFPTAAPCSIQWYPYPAVKTMKWQRNFIMAIDKLPGLYVAITAARALEILEAV